MLYANDLACVKGDRPLFRGLNLQVAPGAMLRVAGPNGYGKTSLLRILCGLALPESGEIRWNDVPINRDRETFHRALLYLGHAAALNDLLTPLENLRFSCAAGGDKVDEDICIDALVRIGLAEQLDLPARVLSQGQRRRVGLARLFLGTRRKLWVLDEPFTALDVAAVADLAATLSDHCAAGGMVVLTTHQDAPFAKPPAVLNLAEVAW
ncbi:cytochrome c biogenesis heme-transporting ATPase CcmA [Aromatoleum diolicum]|uniref:Cytochrome c biogenesis heme-transporting ATPase CcmA n=1 Tax=Aromatoleum diolicum TaxID=75796 RepID=A0ABX1QDX4_9RHOO|nr:cytochrome c biogenesis heme-transporting ATPase CcmA [Aromatoleum diolicum]NMG75710.1 cytochrome c biogenesis heme-transporting ATPase CcmA [Aromatoleum diolicum]